MAPPHILPNQVHPLFPLSAGLHRHCRSKAQMCLFKILRIISVFPAEKVADKHCLSIHEENCETRGLDVDLNACLRPLTDIEPFEPPVTADGGVDGENCVPVKNNRRKCESYDMERSELAFEEKIAAVESEISDVGGHSSGIDFDGVFEEEKTRDEGCLGLLIEAAQLILSENESKPLSLKSDPPISKYVESSAAAAVVGGGTKRKQQCWTDEWCAEFESTSPVLKSKRGRNLVLPGKYRDSVVEPLVRWTPSARRSNSPADRLVSKRRSK